MSDIRKYINLIESATFPRGNAPKNFIGTCVTSFDEDTMEYFGDALEDINDFAVIDEDYVNDENHDPSLLNHLKGYIPDLEDDALIVYVEPRDLIIIYQPDEDIHYFYE